MSQYIALLLLIAAPWPAQDADPIKTLITDLGDESVAVRASAQLALIAAGTRAIPRLRDALNSLDAEVQQRASAALGELEQAEKLADVMKSLPPVTMSLQNAPFARALEELTRQCGVRFESGFTLPDPPITATFTRAPLMQVLDALAGAVELQWSFESETVVSWLKSPPVPRPTCYSGGFRTALSRIDVYRSWNFQRGRGLMWMFLETRMEPGFRPVGFPRFEVSELQDEAGNELSRDFQIQACSRRGCSPDAVGGNLGAVYESSPFTINPLDPSVKKLSKVSGRALFLFPLDKSPLEIDDLCEGTSATRGKLDFQVNDILSSSLKLTLVSNGDVSTLIHHVDVDSLVLIDAEGREYVRGTDFEVCAVPLSIASLQYGIQFRESICFQPVALRFLVTGTFLEKSVPFEFKDIVLP
jgi:hypothetical protein